MPERIIGLESALEDVRTELSSTTITSAPARTIAAGAASSSAGKHRYRSRRQSSGAAWSAVEMQGRCWLRSLGLLP